MKWLLVAGIVAVAALSMGAKGGKKAAITVTDEPSIVLDQATPHDGDTLTFTTSGGTNVTVACYQALGTGTGPSYAEKKAVGESFTVDVVDGVEALCYAWLDDDDLLADTGFIAVTSFLLP